MADRVVVYSGPLEALAALQVAVEGQFEVRRVEPTTVGIMAGLKDACVFVDASMKVPIDKAIIELAPKLELVVTATTGADHIDWLALQRRGIPLLTLRGQSDILEKLTPAAEHSWLLLMACARRFRAALDNVIEGEWVRVDFPGIMLKGSTLGLLGCGRIGRFMASYARTFGMDVLGYDPHVKVWPSTIKKVALDYLLSTSDFVSIHVPLNEETRFFMNRERLARMKVGAVLINTSRGDVVDEMALLDMLQQGRIASAGLDVLSGEPDIREHPLLIYARSHKNLMITPHIGGFSPDAVRLTVEFSGRRILQHFGLEA